MPGSANSPRPERLSSLDSLRGAVMILMALDHVRDFIHVGAQVGLSPTDLASTTPILFFTRWVTHFCLPVFMFTAGAGIYLRGERVEKSRLSKFLLTRGLWFILLELTVMRVAYNFNFSLTFPLFLLVLWIFGLCMLAMAALIYLPIRLLAVLSVAAIALHDTLDSIKANGIWMFVHQPGIIPFHGTFILITYTLIPWIAVMSAGYCFGQVFRWTPAVRQRYMFRTGIGLTIAFLLLRTINVYGDPVPQSGTLLSFLNCTKYPASLEFLLMTLGPALIVLALLDRYPLSLRNPLAVFGRVPLFYFILHFYVIHLVAVVMAWVRYGPAASAFTFSPLPSMGGAKQLFPPHFGYSLPVVYLVWIAVVLLLYPICLRFARFRDGNRAWWLSYL